MQAKKTGGNRRYGFYYEHLVNNQLLRPYFFDKNLKGELYLRFLRYHLPRMIKNLPQDLSSHINRDRLIFHQDGTNLSSNVIWWSRYHGGSTWRSREYAIIGPARSPDGTPFDFYLWEYLKDKIYVNAKDGEFEKMCNNVQFVLFVRVVFRISSLIIAVIYIANLWYYLR